MTSLHHVRQYSVVLNNLGKLRRQIVFVTALSASRINRERLVTHFPASEATDGLIHGGGTEIYCQI